MKTTDTITRKRSLKIACFLLFAMTLLVSNDLSAQTGELTVSGIVKSHDGPVAYATVMLKGTTTGVSTDENGAFTFPKMLKENDVLHISFLGYKDDFVKISKGTAVINPFLEDIPLVIVASLRTAPSTPIPAN